MPGELQSLLDVIPGPNQAGQTAGIVPDQRANNEYTKWQGEIKTTIHKVITWSLLLAFCVLALLLAVRALHLILPVPERAITLDWFWDRRICCWLTEAQLTTIDHLLLSGGVISLVGSRVGKTLSDNLPY
jgi:hypothetical protein